MTTASSIGAAAYAVAVIASLCTASAAISRFARNDVLDRALVASISAISIAAGVPLVLSMAGVLSSVPYLAMMLAIGAAGAAVLLRAPETPQRVPAAWSLAGLVALATGVALAVLAFIPTLLGLGTGHPDSRKYHIVNLVTLARNHTLWTLPYQSPGFFTATHPTNGELTAIGMLFATHGDQLVYTANIVFGAITVLACATIARDLDGRPHQAAMAAMAIMSAPIVFGTQAHGLATDLPSTAGLVAGLAAILRARHEAHDRVRWIVLAGFALGFALGAKYTVLFLVPVVIVGAVLLIRPRRDTVWLAPGIVLLAGPWFIRNWVTTGNPLFPQRIAIGSFEIFPGGDSPLLALKTPILTHFLAGHTTIIERFLHLSWDYLGPAALLAVAGVIGVVFQRPRRPERLAIAALAVAAWFVYAITPYTGAGRNGLEFLIGSNLRYTMPAMFVGVALAAVGVPSRLLIALTTITFGFNAWKMLAGYGFRTDLDLSVARVALAALAVALVCGAIVTFGKRRVRIGPPVYVATLVVACAVLGAALVKIDRSVTETPLEQLLAANNAHDVIVAGGDDLRSVMGDDLDRKLEGVSSGGAAGERPPATEAELTSKVEASEADALVVKAGTPGVPAGWTPPSDWKHVGSTAGGDVYVRSS